MSPNLLYSMFLLFTFYVFSTLFLREKKQPNRSLTLKDVMYAGKSVAPTLYTLFFHHLNFSHYSGAINKKINKVKCKMRGNSDLNNGRLGLRSIDRLMLCASPRLAGAINCHLMHFLQICGVAALDDEHIHFVGQEAYVHRTVMGRI